MAKRSEKFNDYFSKCSAKQQIALWFSFTSVSRSETKVDALIDDLGSEEYQTVLQTLFQLNLSQAKVFFDNENKKVLATSFCFSAVCNQMTYIAEKVESASRYQHIALIWQPLIVTKEIYNSSDFNNFNYLFIPDFTFSHELSFISAIFLPETNAFLSWGLPEETVRIGCPHGIDIPLKDTLYKYGGALQFEYIIQAKVDNGNEDKVYRYIPELLIEHNAKTISLVPTGIPKLDKLYRLAREKNDRKVCIGYHLSNWEIESEHVRKNIAVTIAAMVQGFPEFDIIIRPFPGDIERPELKAQLEAFADIPRVNISLNSSYVDDYANIDVLVTHRVNTGHNFALATGRPIITFLENNQTQTVQTDLGYQVNDLNSLIRQLTYCFKSAKMESERIENYANSLVFNIGHSLDYLMVNIETIINRKTKITWPKLVAKSKKCINNNIEQSIESCIKDNIPFIHLALAAVDKYPQNALFNYFAAAAYSNPPEPNEHQYYFLHWYLALKYFKNAITFCRCDDERVLKSLHKWYCQFYSTYLQGVAKYYGDNHHEVSTLINELQEVEFQHKYLQVLQDIEINHQDMSTMSSAFDVARLLDDIPTGVEAIYLYGAGEIAREVIYCLEQLTSLKIIAVFDKKADKFKDNVMGHTIQHRQKKQRFEYPIIICSIAFSNEIEHELINLSEQRKKIIKLLPIQ